MNRKQSSAQTRCIKIVVKDNKIDLTTTQLDDSESLIHILEVCIDKLRDKTSLKEVPIGKEK